ncbi:MAG: class I SAM-dependent methyltransferase [Ginsengibacter sp.]
MKTLKVFQYPLYWEMTNHEKIALLQLMQDIKPELAIEIGCNEGGSLQLISEYSKEVYSLDINPKVRSLKTKFSNVNFIIGESQKTLPGLLQKLLEEGKSPDFVLIDAEHSTEGVCRDINMVLQMKITRPLTILMHDSFNPNCRQGMLMANYFENNNIHFVDIDFLHGTYSVSESVKGQMWGGFGLIIMKPEINKHTLEIKQSSKYSFDQTLTVSRHINYNAVKFSEKVKSYLLKKFIIN